MDFATPMRSAHLLSCKPDAEDRKKGYPKMVVTPGSAAKSSTSSVLEAVDMVWDRGHRKNGTGLNYTAAGPNKVLQRQN